MSGGRHRIVHVALMVAMSSIAVVCNAAEQRPAPIALPDRLRIFSAAFSPVQQTLYVGVSAKIYEIDWAAGKITRTLTIKPLPRTDGRVEELLVSPDGKRLAARVDGRRLVIIDLENAAMRETTLSKSPKKCLFFTAGGDMAVVGAEGIESFDPATGKPAKAMAFPPLRGAAILLFAVSGDGALAACVKSTASKRLEVIDLGSGRTLFTDEPVQGDASTMPVGVSMSADGKLACIGYQASAFLYDVATGKAVSKVTPSFGERIPPKVYRGAALSPDGRYLVQILEPGLLQWKYEDKVTLLWSATYIGKDNQPTLTRYGGPPDGAENATVTRPVFTADGQHFVVPAGAGEVSVINMAPPKDRQIFIPPVRTPPKFTPVVPKIQQ